MGFLSTSCVLKGSEFQSPSNPSELPRHLDAPLQARNTIYGHLLLFPTPLGQQPSRPKSFNHGTQDLCSHACVEWVDNGMAEGENAEYKQSKERSRITQIKAGCRWHTFSDLVVKLERGGECRGSKSQHTWLGLTIQVPTCLHWQRPRSNT